MSFHESDFPSLIKRIGNINEKYKHPALSEKIILELGKIYDTIPIYPGLVENTIFNMIKEVKESDLKKGEWIAFEKSGKKYAGRIKNIDKDSIEFENLIVISEIEDKRISTSEVNNIIKINEDQLKEDWPMLIFDKVE